MEQHHAHYRPFLVGGGTIVVVMIVVVIMIIVGVQLVWNL
jgi:hypothetical protein